MSLSNSGTKSSRPDQHEHSDFLSTPIRKGFGRGSGMNIDCAVFRDSKNNWLGWRKQAMLGSGEGLAGLGCQGYPEPRAEG